MRRLVAHKGWGGIYNGTSRQRGFGGVFIGRRFQGGGFWGSLFKGIGQVATSVGKKVAGTAGSLGKKAMSVGKQAVTELGKKGKQAATELGKTAVRGLTKQAEKLAKSGKLKRKVVEAVTNVIPEKVGKFGTKQIVNTIEKAVGKKKKKAPPPELPEEVPPVESVGQKLPPSKISTKLVRPGPRKKSKTSRKKSTPLRKRHIFDPSY